MAIFIGPGGVPISSHDRSTIGGIKHCSKLGLNAMEVEFVRGVNMSKEMAVEVGKVAKELNIKLSCHAPYYINLLSEKKSIVHASIQRIVDTLDRAERMNADAIAVHAAYYGKLTPEEAQKKMEAITEEILSKAEKLGIKHVKLGYETMGKVSQWGSLEEISELCKKFHKKVIPYLDWGHLFVRGNGKIDYEVILEHMRKLGISHINSHFNSVKYSSASKQYVDVHVPIAAKSPDFAELAKLLVKHKTSITLISETPVLEQDSLRMKEILEKIGYKF
ncbi:MAG: TIM barrel protein [Candidatus Nanoarchaeia archaeon]